jgi:large subunit ribosomal protein L24
MLVVDGKTTRVGIKEERDENGKVVKKSRVAKATGEVIDVIYPSQKKN